ncbi:unnamed protein product [Didymodactylos carnosus]|uniref:non-specific serine/threonine protein kinase n=1 Tax=Didymodactylos carnosus TaxID=1234261 RepID=A0A813PKZ5_9BILA|nr:unnamed protein product [Didymodactylos carnosus]CAF0754954.1 unnamed protein product [Didymodactylos carnosus]CAF3502431.1 unnamed protein product [Didymodactylos carnosus]CAF3535178.1 unnamed protein product [Didymodactylos carnosus]
MDWLTTVDEHWLHSSPWLEKKSSPLTSFDVSYRDYIYPSTDRLTSPRVFANMPDRSDYYSDTSYYSKPVRRKTFNRDYETLGCIGVGGFGRAYEGRRRFDNAAVVIKFLPKTSILNWGTFEGKRVPYEIEILWRLRGVPGVIKILEHFEEKDRFIFIMEKIPASVTIFEYVMENGSLASTELLRHIILEIIRINITLKMYGVWHRDCKPENILYCMNDRSLCFIDFGSAAPMQSGDFGEFQGTLEIMVPEWITQRRYSGEAACVWTIGICLYFLLFQQYPFRSKVEIMNGRNWLSFVTSTDKQAMHTLKQCLSFNENRRPRLSELSRQSWLANL